MAYTSICGIRWNLFHVQQTTYLHPFQKHQNIHKGTVIELYSEMLLFTA